MNACAYFTCFAILMELSQSKTINITMEAEDLLKIMDKFYTATSNVQHNIGRSGSIPTKSHIEVNPYHPEDSIVELSLSKFKNKYHVPDDKNPLRTEFVSSASKRQEYEETNKRLELENKQAEKENSERYRTIKEKKKGDFLDDKIRIEDRDIASLEREYAKEFVGSIPTRHQNPVRTSNQHRKIPLKRQKPGLLIPDETIKLVQQAQNHGVLKIDADMLSKRKEALISLIAKKRQNDEESKLSSLKLGSKKSRRYFDFTSKEQAEIRNNENKPTKRYNLEPRLESDLEYVNKYDESNEGRVRKTIRQKKSEKNKWGHL